MSKRGMDAPLAVQMDRLKKHMTSRDSRRNQGRLQRQANAEGVDPYDTKPSTAAATGGVELGPAAAANAAVANAAALAGPAILRCELCNATFKGEAAFRQHEDGPIHKKAVAKAEKERQQGFTNDAAETALAAAAWLNGGESRRANRQGRQRGGQARHNFPGSGPRQVSGQGRGAALKSQAPELPDKHAGLVRPANFSHSELVAQAMKTTEPLSIGGWVPPAPTQGNPRDEELSDEDSSAADDEEIAEAQAVVDTAGVRPSDDAAEAAALDLEPLVGYGKSSSESEGSESDIEGGEARKMPVSFF